MLHFLLLLSDWQYGGSVRDLGHPEYAVRDQAHSRLAAAGWWAVCSLRCNRSEGAGFPHTPGNYIERGRYSYPERDLRLEILRRKLSLPFNKLLRDLLLQYPLEEPVDPVLADYLWQFRRPLCEWIRQRELFSWHPEPLLWVSLKPYRSGSEVGDYMIVLRQSQRTLLQQSGERHERE